MQEAYSKRGKHLQRKSLASSRANASRHAAAANVHNLIVSDAYFRIKIVHSFEELAGTAFADGVNALCWPRELAGDYREVVDKLGPGEEIVTIAEEQLIRLDVSDSGLVAIGILREDLRRLRDIGREPVLNCIHRYSRDDALVPIQTDVYSFHVDSAPVEADTWLCTYYGAPSEGLPNEQAQRRVDIPETRAELLKFLQMGGDGAEFRDALHEHSFDLHYAPMPQARPFPFGIGNLWRIAVDWPGSPVPPCIHRAPDTHLGEPPRLLLIC
jgi:hypothetical protein